MGRGADDLVGLGSIVDVLVILQDSIEESICRHDVALSIGCYRTMDVILLYNDLCRWEKRDVEMSGAAARAN